MVGYNIVKYTTTVKITDKDGEAIDNYIISGYYPSRSRFVVEAVRDAQFMLDSDLAELFETMKSRGYGLKEAYHEIGVRLHNKYFVESGFLDLEGEKPRIVVTISSQRDFIDCAVSHIGNYLVIRNIQEMVNLCLFLKFQCLKKIEDDKERLLAAKKSFNRSILDYQMDDQEPSTWLNEYHEPYSDDRFWLRRGEVDAAVVSPSIKTKNKRKKPRQGTP